MNIALIAHDEKKELMGSSALLTAVFSAATTLRHRHNRQNGVRGNRSSIQKFLAGSQGGSQQIAARIACNEIDMLLFFRDPLNPKPNEPNDMNMLRLCDMHNIPVATNIATAEVLIHGLERGDLDWRNILK